MKKKRRGTDNICWKYIRSIEVYYNLDQKFWFWIIFNSYISVIFIYIMSIKIKNYKITDDKVNYFNKFLGTERKLFFTLKKKRISSSYTPLPPDKFTTTGRVIFHEWSVEFEL